MKKLSLIPVVLGLLSLSLISGAGLRATFATSASVKASQPSVTVAGSVFKLDAGTLLADSPAPPNFGG